MRSKFAHTILKPSKIVEIFSYKILGMLQNPIGSFWCSKFPHGSTILQSCLNPVDNSIWYYPVFKSNYYAYVKTYIFIIIYCIFRVSNGSLQILWFRFIKFYKNITIPFLGWIKVGIPTMIYLLFKAPLSVKTFLLPYWILFCVLLVQGTV